MDIFQLLQEENPHLFVPKDGKDPKREKWLDTRRLRNQVANWHHIEIDDSGFPVGFRGVIRTPFARPNFVKEMRKKNGRVEWLGSGDAWSKPWVQGKSSRQRMREAARWWEEAHIALFDEDDF